MHQMPEFSPGLFSYCPDHEDLILARFFADIEQGFYVDVGACLPQGGSVTKYFYDRLWHGINIEPLPEYFSALCRERPRDVNLNIGISNARGKQTLYSCGGLSTLNASTANTLLQTGQGVFQEIEITVCTLDDVFNAYVGNREVHFLKVDVETHEREVLESLNFQKYVPWVLCVESTFPYTMDSLHEQWEHILVEAGYQCALQHSVNRYYIHQWYAAQRIHVFKTNDFIPISI